MRPSELSDLATSLNSLTVQVVEFSSRGTKSERFLSKNQHTERKLLNFENWVDGEVSKLGIILKVK
jgi:hypothetical protein